MTNVDKIMKDKGIIMIREILKSNGLSSVDAF